MKLIDQFPEFALKFGLTKRVRKRSSESVKKLVNGKMKKGKEINGIFQTFDQINATTAQAKELAKEKLLGANSITEVAEDSVIVYKNAKYASQIKNGNKLLCNNTQIHMPKVGGAVFEYPISLISNDSKKSTK